MLKGISQNPYLREAATEEDANSIIFLCSDMSNYIQAISNCWWWLHINMSNKIFVIAEAGVNHNGSLVKAKKLIDIVSHCGGRNHFNYLKLMKIFSRVPVNDYVKKF